MHINLHLLRLFFTVAEQRSFSRAAEILFVSQPAVSKAVRALERQLDLPLLERGPAGAKGVRLTENGSALFEHARGIFALERAASEDIRARVELRRGRLSVGASTTVASYWLPAYVAEFAARHPAVDLKVGIGNTQSVGQALVDCEFDIALVEGVVDDPRVVSTHWRDDELRIFTRPATPARRGHKLTPADLNAQVWLLREPGSGTREVTEQMLRKYRITPQRTLELGSNEGIARAVAAGLGIAALPLRAVHELLLLKRIETVHYAGSPGFLRPLFMLQLKERPPSPLVRAFSEVLQHSLEKPHP